MGSTMSSRSKPRKPHGRHADDVFAIIGNEHYQRHLEAIFAGGFQPTKVWSSQTGTITTVTTRRRSKPYKHQISHQDAAKSTPTAAAKQQPPRMNKQPSAMQCVQNRLVASYTRSSTVRSPTTNTKQSRSVRKLHARIKSDPYAV